MIPERLRNTVTHGDAWELLAELPSGSIDLIFTDPVYENTADYKRLHREADRLLTPGGFLLAFQDSRFLQETLWTVGETKTLPYQDLIIWFKNNQSKILYSVVGKSVYVPAIVYSRPGANRTRPGFCFNLRGFSWITNTNFKWSKPIGFITYYVDGLCPPGGVVLDPFCGGGTMGAGAKISGKDYICFERDAETAAIAQERIEQQQRPLVSVPPVQKELDL